MAPILALVAVEDVVERAALRELPASEHETLLVRLRDTLRVLNHLLYVADGVGWHDIELYSDTRAGDLDENRHALFSIRALGCPRGFILGFYSVFLSISTVAARIGCSLVRLPEGLLAKGFKPARGQARGIS